MVISWWALAIFTPPKRYSWPVFTRNVLGDRYVSLQPGGSDLPLRAGDEIAYTQGAIVVERTLGKLIHQFGGG